MKLKISARPPDSCNPLTVLDHVWIDTCCIDKRSSTELSESINAMFTFYKRAELCLIYLADIAAGLNNDLTPSTWFTRGWTLQEMLAPKRSIFCNRDWKFIGHNADYINHSRIIRFGPSSSESAAMVFSWAADRETSREEDVAYCLLGILDINMPLLYGEGGHAFRRLQMEVLSEHGDDTVF
ncbi:hypothetical protein BAUCODRAFT_76519, partial [Baudoinia panamericana UAMH 10762]